MNKRIPLIVAGVIFSLVALTHLIRIIYHWHIIIAGKNIPLSASVGGLIVAIVLAIWMFMAARKGK